MKTTTHPWTHLGSAPFRCVGMTDLRAKRAELASGVELHTQGGGSCRACGTTIRYAYQIEAACGARFYVGSECVRKTGDAKLAAVVARLEKSRARKQAAARKGRVVSARAEVASAQLDHVRAACECVVETGAGWARPIAADFVRQLEAGRPLSPKQEALLAKMSIAG